MWFFSLLYCISDSHLRLRYRPHKGSELSQNSFIWQFCHNSEGYEEKNNHVIGYSPHNFQFDQTDCWVGKKIIVMNKSSYPIVQGVRQIFQLLTLWNAFLVFQSVSKLLMKKYHSREKCTTMLFTNEFWTWREMNYQQIRCNYKSALLGQLQKHHRSKFLQFLLSISNEEGQVDFGQNYVILITNIYWDLLENHTKKWFLWIHIKRMFSKS